MMNRRSPSRRKKRHAAPRATRTYRQFMVPAALALSVGIPAMVATLQTNGVNIPGISAGANLLAMLEERSPGERTAGELAASKQKKLAEAPRQRALGKIHQPEAPPELIQALIPPSPELLVAPPLAVPVKEPLLAALAPPLAAPGSVPGGSVPGGGGSPGGGGPGGGGEVPPTPPPVTPPVPAVPEPTTWAMMLLGFGSIGFMLRRSRRDSVMAASPIR